MLTDVFCIPKEVPATIKLVRSFAGGIKRTLITGDIREVGRSVTYSTVKSTIKGLIRSAASYTLSAFLLPIPPFLK